MNISVLPILGIMFPIAILALVFAYAFAMRVLTHKERMAMIEKGMMPHFPIPDPTGRDLLRRGMVTSLVGVALLIGLWTIGIGPWLIGGLIPLFAGVAMLISYYIAVPTKEVEELPNEAEE